MDKIAAIETMVIAVILGYQWLINRRFLRIIDALSKRIDALERREEAGRA